MYGHLPIYIFVKLSQFIKSADSLIKLKELHCNELYVKALFVASHDALHPSQQFLICIGMFSWVKPVLIALSEDKEQ